MSPRLLKRPFALLGFASVLTAAFACGPFFPSTVIDQGDAGLLASPLITFRQVLDRSLLPKAEFTAVSSPKEQWQDTDYAAQTLAGELADLRAAGVADAVISRHLQRRASLGNRPDYAEPESTTDLPREFALYFTGAEAFLKNDLPAARSAFTAVLALPEKERRYKTVWAAYMLGKVAARPGDSTTAITWFGRTRQLAEKGFVDSTGLAAASLGEEARFAYDQKDWFTACELYLRQYATGDLTALNSLRFTAARALSDPNPAVFTAFAQKPGPRAVLTARLLERGQTTFPGMIEEIYPFTYENEASEPDTTLRRWLAALENAKASSSREAGLFALAAYRSGAFADCARWLSLADPDEPGPLWLRIKLALRDGRIDEATTLLAGLVRSSAIPFDNSPNLPQLRGDLAQLRLARRDYTDALRLLLRGNYWEDAAYVAERVLTLDELATFLRTETGLADNEAPLRHLLGRRLVRTDKLAEAVAYLPAELTAPLKLYIDQLTAGHDAQRPAVARGLSLARAAGIMRKSGIELCGTELDPDFAIYSGSYGLRSMLDSRSRVGGASTPSDDEVVRAMAHATAPNLRFHYRYRAADLAWEAAALLPDNSNELVQLLIEAGGWIKANDPQAADRFYKALVNRCPDTDLGREAKRLRWFPKYY